LPEATPPLFSMIFMSASMPSSMSVKARFWAPPSTRLMFSPRTMWPRNCVTTRELPSFGAWIESRPAPIQLNGRKSVKSRLPIEP
jgi:hypothetical protein